MELSIRKPDLGKPACLAAAALVALFVLPGSGQARRVPQAAAAPQGASGRPSQITVEGNPQLFATMCALYAAGYGQDLNLTGSPPVRQKLARQTTGMTGPATDALRQFYHDHELADRAATLSRYISFAMVAGPPPKFAYRVSHEDLPPDVLTIESFNDVLAGFYAEAQLDQLWRSVQPDYDREIAQLSGPVSRIVLSSTAYLRELISASNPRTFSVYVEPLVGEKTNFRNYGVHYDIVVSVGGDPPLDEIRHAFLHYLLEPMVLKNAALVAQKRALLPIAARAPRLPSEYREDFIALFTECFVRAVELRLRRLPADRLAAAINQADLEGFVLIRPINRELQNFEKAEPAMSFYFPDLVKAIDPEAETKRLQAVVFAPVEEAPAPQQARTAPTLPSDLIRWLQEGNSALRTNDVTSAKAAFQRALDKYPNQPRAMFGLAVTAVLEGDANRARELFQKLLAPAAAGGAEAAGEKDSLVVAWAHVYLGHIYDVDRDRDSALREYRAALSVENAPEEATKAAQRGLEKPYGPPPKNPKDGQPNR